MSPFALVHRIFGSHEDGTKVVWQNLPELDINHIVELGLLGQTLRFVASDGNDSVGLFDVMQQFRIGTVFGRPASTLGLVWCVIGIMSSNFGSSMECRKDVAAGNLACCARQAWAPTLPFGNQVVCAARNCSRLFRNL